MGLMNKLLERLDELDEIIVDQQMALEDALNLDQQSSVEDALSFADDLEAIALEMRTSIEAPGEYHDEEE